MTQPFTNPFTLKNASPKVIQCLLAALLAASAGAQGYVDPSTYLFDRDRGSITQGLPSPSQSQTLASGLQLSFLSPTPVFFSPQRVSLSLKNAKAGWLYLSVHNPETGTFTPIAPIKVRGGSSETLEFSLPRGLRTGNYTLLALFATEPLGRQPQSLQRLNTSPEVARLSFQVRSRWSVTDFFPQSPEDGSDIFNDPRQPVVPRPF